MERFALVVKQDTLSKAVANTICEGLSTFLQYDEEKPDIVISVGGDGTMLESVHKYVTCDCFFMGVHTGTLGFFTDYQKEEIDILITDIREQTYTINQRHLLEITIHQKSGNQMVYALNEVRMDHGFATQVIEVYINEDLLETFRGNGLCVSTPSGSTAYNKSLGGAVIFPGNPLMQLTEVAGIHHNAYRSLGSSLVLDDKQVIRFVRPKEEELYIGVDHLTHHFVDVKTLEVKISKKVVQFLEYREMSFIKRIRRAYINS